MRATVIGINSGTEYTDGRRRVRIRIDAADSIFNTITISEKALGIAGLMLDDPIEVAFGCDAVKVREERRVAKSLASSKQDGCAI
jgi:hypothetical protein